MPSVTLKPKWLTIRPPEHKETYDDVKSILTKHNLNTVCQEARCPNISECWSGGTATFMVLGDTCTRGCRFCHIKTSATPNPPDPHEPEKLAQAIEEMGVFDYVVLTSVDRDDLPDEGAGHFAACIKAIKEKNPDMIVEVLIPDFREEGVKKVIDAGADVVAHNIETVERLQSKVRDNRANFQRSLTVLEHAKKYKPDIFTKSSIMLGVGETQEEVVDAMKSLREIGVDIVTLGQYLQPTPRHLKLERYATPEEFSYFKQKAQELGFRSAAAGPFIRSSYKAGEVFRHHA